MVVLVALYLATVLLSAAYALTVGRANAGVAIPWRSQPTGRTVLSTTLWLLALTVTTTAATAAGHHVALWLGYLTALVCFFVPFTVGVAAHNRRVRRSDGADAAAAASGRGSER